ncbi:MAG TPA: cytochrome c3 family protein [Pseudolabrys sp.]|nr:cytochrome c3 family protein [Pseudolabrys sp.]
MPQLFRPVADTIARIALIAILAAPFLAMGAGYAVMRSQYVTRQSITPEQPVPFSHAHHVGQVGLDCRYCHSSVENAAFAGMPSTHTCMTCHSQLFTNVPMLAPVRASLAEQKPLHWTRVHRLPDYVYFDHSVHIKNGVGCSTCHGAVQHMPLMRQVAPLTMSWCLDCHRDPKPYLRPQSEIFNMDWKPPHDQAARARKLMTQYLIDTQHLTDCSRCHR